jgi:hypothetical protein
MRKLCAVYSKLQGTLLMLLLPLLPLLLLLLLLVLLVLLLLLLLLLVLLPHWHPLLLHTTQRGP